MRTKKELKADLKLSKVNEAYHRKLMEYHLEEIKLIEGAIKESI